MSRLTTALRRAHLDWMIGWHDGRATRDERRAAIHREQETLWRNRYATQHPTTHTVPHN